MKLVKYSLVALGLAPLLCLLLIIPFIVLAPALAGAFGFAVFLAALILVQWPVFCIFREILPQGPDE